MRLSRASATSVWRLSMISRALMLSLEGLGGIGMSGGMIRGDRPKRRWKGENPVDLLMELMMWKRFRGKARTQPFWFLSTWNLKHWFTVLFVRSLTLLDCGWKLLEALHLTPVRRVRCFQKEDMKSLSRSETMSVGKPFSQYHLSKNRTASSLAVREVEVRMMRISEDKRSVMVKMQSKPWSRGSGPMKSIDID